MLAFIAGAGEGLLNLAEVKALFPVPSLGTNFRSLDIKMAALEIQIRNKGHLPCVIIGSSMPFVGINPQILESKLGVQCFNFSLNGMSANGAGTLGRILAWRFRPEYLIYAADMRAFVETESTLSWRTEIIGSPWVQYQLGKWNLDSWLLDHSQFYAELMAFSFWAHPLEEWLVRPSDLSSYSGYEPIQDQKIDVRLGLTETEITGREIYTSLQNYQLEEEETRGLEQFLDLPHETQLILVEMPVHQSFFLYLGRGAEDRKTFINELEAFSTKNHVPLITSYGALDIPDKDWADRNHVTANGASIFSSWLAGQLSLYMESDK